MHTAIYQKNVLINIHEKFKNINLRDFFYKFTFFNERVNCF